MKKIVFTVTNDLNFDQRMIRICSTLQQEGYSVLLVGRQRKNSMPLANQNFEQHRLPCFFEKGKFFYLEYNLRLFFFLIKSNFDLVCGIDLDTLLPALLIARLKRKTCIYDAHEYYTESPELVDRLLTKNLWGMLAYLSIPRVDGAYTVCESLAKIMGERYRLHFDVIRNVPFPLPVQTVRPTRHGKVLLYQGALNDGRGLPELIDAMQQVESAVLWLAGEGDLSEKLRQQVKDLHLEKKVIFLGFVRPAELKDITSQAHIGLNLLENKGLSYYYSLANKAFDYIQSEKPAIHMDFPEYRLLNKTYETGVLIPDLKSKTIKDAIIKLVEDQATYQRLQENTRKAKLIYHWGEEKKKLIKYYQNIFKP